MKEFKARKIKKENKHIKYFFLFIFFFCYVFVFLYLKDTNFKLNKDVLSNNINYYKINIINSVNKKIDSILKKPTYFLNSNIKKVKVKKEDKSISNNNAIKKVNLLNNDIETSDDFKPVIYIYNTHNSESYIDYNVLDASFLLSKILSENKIDNYVEEKSVATFLQTNNLKYYESYNISRNYLLDAKDKYDTITYYIDIHRDTQSKEKSTVSYDGRNYAKILFLIGLENENYQKNLNNTNELDAIIKSKVPNISRGVLTKKGQNVNGIYNQDISENVFLIEVGSLYNTKEEVENTINVIALAFKEYIKR